MIIYFDPFTPGKDDEYVLYWGEDLIPYTKAKVAGELHIVGFPTSYDGMLYVKREGFQIAEVDLEDTKDTLAVTNPEPAVGGGAQQDLDSIRQNAMAHFAAQNRIITREDYISRVYARVYSQAGPLRAPLRRDQ